LSKLDYIFSNLDNLSKMSKAAEEASKKDVIENIYKEIEKLI
jgi:DNA phosphorothioation-dependent restriction protein DptG